MKDKSIVLEAEEIIELMTVYLDEWKHRNSLLWSQIFKMFSANIFIIVLPNISEYLGIQLPSINKMIFPCIGAIVALAFLYISLGYEKRQEASRKSYIKVMKLLDNEEYYYVKLEDLRYGRLFKAPLAKLLIYIMFLALELIAVSLLCI